MKIKASVFIFLYSTLIIRMSDSLGLISQTGARVDPDIKYGTIDNFLEAIGFAIDVVLDNIGVFVQFMTLQTELPFIINSFLVAPIYIVTTMLVMLMIRGN